MVVLASGQPLWDARAYWVTDGAAPYLISGEGQANAYLYSPAFLQAIAPLRDLPWEWFAFVWLTIHPPPALVVLTRQWLPLALVVPFVGLELAVGNIHFLLALAVIVGVRYPATWSFVLLTKITPGVGLVWFIARREWRKLGIALGMTSVVVAISFAVAPDQWLAWRESLTATLNSNGRIRCSDPALGTTLSWRACSRLGSALGSPMDAPRRGDARTPHSVAIESGDARGSAARRPPPDTSALGPFASGRAAMTTPGATDRLPVSRGMGTSSAQRGRSLQNTASASAERLRYRASVLAPDDPVRCSSWRPSSRLRYDLRAYWGVDPLDPYATTSANLSGQGVFRYAPPVALMFAPFGRLPIEAAQLVWLALQLGALWMIGRRWFLAPSSSRRSGWTSSTATSTSCSRPLR